MTECLICGAIDPKPGQRCQPLCFLKYEPGALTMTLCGPPKNIGFDMIDELECPCGWKSGPYFDGAEYAHAEWKKHAAAPSYGEQMPENPR